MGISILIMESTTRETKTMLNLCENKDHVRDSGTTEGCWGCLAFRCPSCGKIVPGTNGGTDDENCDDCWLSHQEAEHADA